MDSGFRHDQALRFDAKRHAISFGLSAMDTPTEMIMMGDCYRMNSYNKNNNHNNQAGVMFSGVVNSGVVNSGVTGYAQIGNSCGSELVPGLKHDAGLAVEWSVEEQLKLEEGISIYANEPNIMKYVKIAATLRDKTVRDVALRCRWMMSKKRKQDALKLGRKLKDKKDKLVELSSKPVTSSNSTMNVVAPFSVTMNNRIQSGGTPLEALNISTRRLLEQNGQVLGQISANISALKLQDNVNLFNHAKNNLTAILNDMRYLPGPPLPVSLNSDLVNTILPTTSQTMPFGSSSRVHLKQESEY